MLYVNSQYKGTWKTCGEIGHNKHDFCYRGDADLKIPVWNKTGHTKKGCCKKTWYGKHGSNQAP